MSKNIAIILAAGNSTRFNSILPKQYTLLHNKPLFYYSLFTFLNHHLIDMVLPIINYKHKDLFNNFFNKYSLKKNKKLLPYIFGGKERYDSVYSGIKYIQKFNNISKVLIHDGARPLVSNDIITRVINNTTSSQGCVPILKIEDSLKKISPHNFIIEDINRNECVKVQTPQCFPYELLLKSYKQPVTTSPTDDSSLFINNNLKVTTTLGSFLNNKITTEEQLSILTKLCSSTQQRIGQGFDVHAFVNNKQLILGGVNIPYIKGLEGHSDADVVLHALVDAMLGSISAGDIGELFPPSDLQWKDASSSIFLLKAKELLEKANATIINIDITILGEEPKLGKYKKDISENIANLLNISSTQVNVKATTTESLGFIGRKEGLAAFANIIININTFNTSILNY